MIREILLSKIVVLKTITVDTIVDVICDKCHQSTYKEENFEYAHLYACWGYYSNHDDEEIDLDLCENCTYEILTWIGYKEKGEPGV